METATNRDKPSAASQAANTSIIIGSILARVKTIVRIVEVLNTNRESIKPSKHKSDDIKWDRYISRPKSDIMNANIMFK